MRSAFALSAWTVRSAFAPAASMRGWIDLNVTDSEICRSPLAVGMPTMAASRQSTMLLRSHRQLGRRARQNLTSRRSRRASIGPGPKRVLLGKGRLGRSLGQVNSFSVFALHFFFPTQSLGRIYRAQSASSMCAHVLLAVYLPSGRLCWLATAASPRPMTACEG